MSPRRRRHVSTWLPTLAVLALVLSAGGRLAVLSVRQHAQQAHETAHALATSAAQGSERELHALTARAASAAATASAALSAGERLDGLKPAQDGFWLTDAGPLHADPADPSIATSITAEWSGADAAPGHPPATLAGPLRHGSSWLLAARAPISVPGAQGVHTLGWSVAYAPLARLVPVSTLTRIANAGYDFALVQRSTAGAGTRVVMSSRDEPLQDAVTSTIQPPAHFAFGPGQGNLQLQLRPRQGWYPPSEIATDVGLLAVVAWLLAFATHDVVHRLYRLQAVLAIERRRLAAANQRLMREIEQRQSLQQSFDHARYHDAFTGLPNRRYFMDQLDRALRELRTRKRVRIAVILTDVDRFKLVNDTLGHTAGDELMVQVARRLEKAAAARDAILARWGGDQFALLVPEVDSADAAAAFTAQLQESLQAPFDVRRHRLNVTMRIGLTVVEGAARRTEDVVREADIALSTAKREGLLTGLLYSPAMGGHAASLVSLEADLHVALERGELKLLFQPIVDLRARRMVGAEALLRWQHPVEGLLRPDRFLPIAEEAGLIVPITRWTVRTVCRLAHQWRRRLPAGTDFFFSINLSAAVLRDPGLRDYIAGVLAETQTPTRTLKFELTEGGLISDVGGARELLEHLHNMGIQLMLDDFGTGYSSLNYLQLFPFDYVKIDRPLVDAAGAERANAGLMSAMVQIATSLGLTPIAEVVETSDAAQTLQQLGCNLGQGYFFSGPIEAEDALHCLRGEAFPDFRQESETEGQVDDSPTLIIPLSELPAGDAGFGA